MMAHTFASLYIKRAGLLQPCLSLTECGLEYGYQGVILRLRQRMTFRVDELQTAAVIEVADLQFVIT
jgi:hypothetical protein